MTVQTIESQDFTLGNLFTAFYAVPSFQREYVWQETDVEQLLKDVYEEFTSDGRSDASEYFIGSIVVCGRSDGVFDLIDGQQRMTTAYLVLCAIRDYLKHLTPPARIDAIAPQIAASDVDERGEDIYRYRVTLQYEDSCDVLAKIASEEDVSKIERSTRSIENILNAYEAILAFFREKFGEDAQTLKRFYAYFTRNIKLIRVKTISLAHALKVFETINDRGVGLDSMDLLKNLMFIEARAQEYERLKDEWKKLVDVLYRAGEKPLRFLRYFIFARYDVERIREDEIYKWFVDNKTLCGYGKKPLWFVGQLLADAQAYSRFIAGQDVNGQVNRYLRNLSYLSGMARQHLILLLAAQHMETSLFSELCRQVENLYFAYVITRSDTRNFEYLFAKWAKEVRTVEDRAALDVFVTQRIQPEKEALAARFELALVQLDERSLQKYRLRYVLAKFTQYINEQAWGSDGPAADLATFITGKVEIEHILPQNPSAGVLLDFDRVDDIESYIHRLGNLTLVEKSINCSIGNGLFAEKRHAYVQSNFLLTKSLGQRVQVGMNTAVNRAVQGLEHFESWTSQSIERRQAMLVRLARKVWDMPEGIRVTDFVPQPVTERSV